MPETLPEVSIIIPTFNEAGYITECLNSLLAGNYPIKKIEILVIDGESQDSTVDEVNNVANSFSNIRCIQNPAKIVPAAMNIGLALASYEIIIWCGAHAKYHTDYIRNSVDTLVNTQLVGSVGGIITPIAKTRAGEAIAIATKSKFGIGKAQYRHATKKEIADTVFGGCFYKASVYKAGGFDEAWVTNQDYEFNYRMRTLVGPIILDPRIRCEYYCRESIPKLARQYFRYGFWRYKTLIKYPTTFSYKLAAPVLLCFGLIVSSLLVIMGSNLGFALPFVYSAACITTSLYLAIHNAQARLAILLPGIFMTLHISWGLGFIVSILKSVFNHLPSLNRLIS